MRKVTALLALVAATFGSGATVIARSGSDSSGTHSYSVECVGSDIVFTNTGSGTIKVLLLILKSFPEFNLAAGESRNVGSPRYPPWAAPEAVSYGVSFEDPEGSGNFHTFDGGEVRPLRHGHDIASDGTGADDARSRPGER